MTHFRVSIAALLFLAVGPVRAQDIPSVPVNSADNACSEYGPYIPHSETLVPQLTFRNPIPVLTQKHRLMGTASYYSGFFEGRRTANGEIFHHRKFTGAHLTLPLGCWVDVRAKATGKVIRICVNDRGPYSGGFVLDLSQSAARALGVDVSEDRRVEMKVVALPGNEPPSEITSKWDEEERAVQVANTSSPVTN